MEICQDKRLKILFEEEETKSLNKNIKTLTYKLRQDLKSIEKKVNNYIKSDFFDINDDLLFQIKENISQSILTELNSFSKKFKLNQEIYAKKYKELVSEEDPTHEINSTIIEENNFKAK